jgi:hypothetical protein
MTFAIVERLSDSTFVKTIWHAQSESAESFISVAVSHWKMVVTRYRGKTTFTVRGPETKATPVDDRWRNAEWIGIRFKPGTSMPHLPPGNLRDRRAVSLPEATSKGFWLHSSAWEFPSFDNVSGSVKVDQ